MTSPDFSREKLLVANRGEIAVRILRTASRLGLQTVAIYSKCDAASPHVALANEAVPLRLQDLDPTSNARGYLDIEEIVKICVEKGVTMVHPGYGFLSENAGFATALLAKGVSWVGPRPELVRTLGLKHEARQLAQQAGVPVIPSSDGALPRELREALGIAADIGYPVMLKATAGGGGMGMVVCTDEEQLGAKFDITRERAKSLFHDDGVFVEKFFPKARHVEVQVFGNGQGHVVHMGERECSIQRRYQKVIEESPSPFMKHHPDVCARMLEAAVELCVSIRYNSAGTVEFLVDDTTGDFYFLEVNTRIQVEHTVTEALHPSLDIVELMLLQAIAEGPSHTGGLTVVQLNAVGQYFAHPLSNQWAMQARVYCENPSASFAPAAGTLQLVSFLQPQPEWLHIDTWVKTGTVVTPFYDPLVAKLIVSATTREDAVQYLLETLRSLKIWGPPNNVAYLQAICEHAVFQAGEAGTGFLKAFEFTPQSLDVLIGGLGTTVQDYPGRKLGLGIPRSGPMDSLALCIANILVGNSEGTEGLEITSPAVSCSFYFHAQAVICVSGASTVVKLNGQSVSMWSRLIIPAKSTVTVGGSTAAHNGGFRAYLAIQGGFPEIPLYLGSKSTSMGLGGYQGRALVSGDQLTLAEYLASSETLSYSLPAPFIPIYPQNHWIIYCLSGPHCDTEFITTSGIEQFFATSWRVGLASNRMGIRLEGPSIQWARVNGGEGGSHPSNIHDNGYALGTVNMNGDTPVILTNEGPDMGGYMCICTVASAELWKLGQLSPGATVQFKCISFENAQELTANQLAYLHSISGFITQGSNDYALHPQMELEHNLNNPKLYILQRSNHPVVVFRQAGDTALLVEYGLAKLDLHIRAHIHAFEVEIQSSNISGIWALSPCIRSIMIHYNPAIVSQSALLNQLVTIAQALPSSMHDACFESRKITFPIVLDDSWNKKAIEQYMKSIRKKAVYLPSNVEYLAKNNGLIGGSEEALRLLVASDWLVLGVGFYLACPFMIPIDPRSRLIAQKMNPSRTFTPRGAIGIAGLVAAIYPIESPGGYQLYGRTLPPWQTWGLGQDFTPSTPWLLKPFDQITFKIITETEYTKIEAEFDAGQYKFLIEPVTFSMAAYDQFINSIQDEILLFKQHQAQGVTDQEQQEKRLLEEWAEEHQLQLQEENAQYSQGVSAEVTSDFTVTSSIAASIWKLTQPPGYMVKSAQDILVILEAMKTEISIQAGEKNVGHTIQSYGPGIKVGAVVNPGQVLVILA